MTSEKHLSTKTAKGIAWVAVEKWAGRLLSFAVFVLLGRLLTPADFGLAALAISISTVLAVFVENGLAQALIQRTEINENDTYTAFWTSIGLALLIYLALLLLSPVLAFSFKQPSLNSIIPISGLVLPLSALSSVPAALLEREMKFANLAARQLAGSVVGAAVAIVAAFNGAGVWALVIQPVVSSFAATLVLWFTTKWRPRWQYSTPAARSLGAFGFQIIAIDFINAMQSNVDKFIVGAYFSPATLGYYFVAQRILTIVMELLSTTFAKVSLTTFSRLKTEPARMMHYFMYLTFAACAVASPVFAMLVAFGDQIMQLLFGHRWSDSVPMMILMVPSALLASVTVFDKNLLLARGKGMTSLGLAASQLVFGTLILLFAVPYGIYAMAAARSIRQFAFWPVRLYALAKYTALPVRRYLMQFVPPLIGSSVLIMIPWGVQKVQWFAEMQQSILFLIPAMSVSFAAYLLILWLMAKRQIKAMMEIIRSLRGNKKNGASS